jgi:dTDP-4-amino-4,6-dideoxygalactose transaminase
MDPLQAIILLDQLPTLDLSNAERRKICNLYAQNLPLAWAMIRADDPRFVGHLAVAIAPDSTERDRARRLLAECNIGSDIHYPVLDSDQLAWEGRGRKVSDLSTSHLLTQKVLSLPCFAEMTSNELEQVIDAVRAF